MRNIFLALVVALAVVFGGMHAYASAHDHVSDAHAESHIGPSHGDDADDDNQASDPQGTEVAHSHVAMVALPDARAAGDLVLKTGSLLPVRDVLALPSRGDPPPIEPPSA